MYVNGDNNSSDEDDSNTNDGLFMAIDELSDNEDLNNEELDDQVEVNIEGELIFALGELEKLRKKNAPLKK